MVGENVNQMGTAPDEQVIERAAALVPVIREFAQQSSEQRCIAPEVMAALANSGLFSLLVPRRHGGAGANLRTMMECVAEIARGDGSTGWVAAVLNACAWFASTFSDQAQEELWGDGKDPRICGVLSPSSESRRVDGGYLVSGRWGFASGSFAADWGVLGMALAVPEGEDPRALALVPASAWTIEPTWFVAGMQGSGSDTINIVDHFIPDHRIQRFGDLAEGRYAAAARSGRNRSDQNRSDQPRPDESRRPEQGEGMSFLPVAALVLVGAQLGLARHAMELTLARLPGRNVAYTRYSQARDSPTHQVAVAQAASLFDQAELVMQRACGDVDTAAWAGRPLTRLVRARARMDTGVIGELVKTGVDGLLSANGASSFADANPLSRIWRDAETAGRHAWVVPDLVKQAYGHLLLGSEEEPIFET